MNRSTSCRLLLAALVLSIASGCTCKLPSWPSRTSKRKPEAPTQVELPFTIELGEPFTIPDLPGRHSFSVGMATADRQTRFLLVGGSGGGLHGFETAATAGSNGDAGPGETTESDGASKPSLSENSMLRVVDVANRTIWSKSLDDLHLPGVDLNALRAINAQSCQDGDWLLIAGGYGFSPDADAPGGMVTFDTLTILKVSQIVEAIITGGEIGDSIQQIRDPLLRVTGGGLQKLGDRYFLVLGQTFDGLYTRQDTGHHFRQTYTRQIRTFRIATEPQLALTDTDRYPKFPGDSIQPDVLPQTDHLRRRDLHVVPTVSPELTSQIAIYGGVFAPGRFDGHLHPIYFDSVVEQYFSLNGYTFPATVISPGIDESCSQLLSQYECASLCLFDAQTRNSYTTFFGGISSYRYERTTNKLVKDKLEVDPKTGHVLVDGLPFIKTVSMLNRQPDGTTVGYVLPDELPGYLGTNAAFLTEPLFDAAPARQFPNGVLLSNVIKTRQLLGHIFGGLEAFGPYSPSAPKPSQASARFIPVFVTPQKQNVKLMPPAP